METVVIDVDGVLADITHRLPLLETKNWKGFFAACPGDTPISAGVRLLEALQRTAYVHVLTGRSEQIRKQTVDWLCLHTGLREHQQDITWQLLMRAWNDYRQVTVYKREALLRLRENGYNLMLLIDDSPRIIEMANELGISTCHFRDAANG